MTDSPDVYLFLFTTKVDNANGPLAVHLPPASESYYWSFDPEGLDHLSQDTLDELNLPQVALKAEALGTRWNQEVYNTIADFYHAKGFDPTTPDVAIKLRYSLVDVDRLNSLINGDKVNLPIATV
jgi:hypothetical protein